MDDIKLAMLGDKEAAKRLTDAGMPHQTLNWRMYHGVLDPRGYRWEVKR